MPTEMTSTEALAFARAHDAVDRALSFPDDVKWRAHDAFVGFKYLGAQPHDIKALLARAWLRVDNAQRLLDERMQMAKEVQGALRKAGDIRRLFDAIHRAALKGYWIGIPDPRLLPAEAFFKIEDVRDILLDQPQLAAAARALYGFSAKLIRGVGAAQHDAIGWFAY